MPIKKLEFTIVAGANGSGKSSLIEQIINRNCHYINPDVLAKKHKGSGNIDFFAMGEVLRQVNENIRTKKSFAVETNLTGTSYLDIARKAQSNGFKIHLIFVTTKDSETNVSRVADRVRKGGHNIPIKTIHQRYKLGHKQLSDHMQQIDNVKIFDNTKQIRLVLNIENRKIKYLSYDIPLPIIKALGADKINRMTENLVNNMDKSQLTNSLKQVKEIIYRERPGSSQVSLDYKLKVKHKALKLCDDQPLVDTLKKEIKLLEEEKIKVDQWGISNLQINHYRNLLQKALQSKNV
jgi:predicted ABC-type ATPase